MGWPAWSFRCVGGRAPRSVSRDPRLRLRPPHAAELGIVEKTIKVHRARVMHKLGVRSVADLVRLAERAHVTPA